jgi:RimJ/RimL family protein N-acetyltransferase
MIKLEPFQESDIDDLISWVDNEELLFNGAGSLFNFPLKKESMMWYVKGSNIVGESDAFIFKVVDVATGRSVGHISLGSVSRKNNSARITRVLIGNKEFAGRGYCKLMIEAAADFGFNELNLHRISLGVYLQNKSAINCYEKAGFLCEGIQREIFLYENSYWSMMEMSMLRRDWETKRQPGLVV